MLRKISFAIVGSTLLLGVATAAQQPSSVSESMPEMTGGQSHPTMGTPATRSKKPTKDIPGPSSVSESMPEMTGGQSHPTMGTSAPRGSKPTKAVPGPSSVSESMPEMTGGQSHPTMGR